MLPCHATVGSSAQETGGHFGHHCWTLTTHEVQHHAVQLGIAQVRRVGDGGGHDLLRRLAGQRRKTRLQPGCATACPRRSETSCAAAACPLRVKCTAPSHKAEHGRCRSRPANWVMLAYVASPVRHAIGEDFCILPCGHSRMQHMQTRGVIRPSMARATLSRLDMMQLAVSTNMRAAPAGPAHRGKRSAFYGTACCPPSSTASTQPADCGACAASSGPAATAVRVSGQGQTLGSRVIAACRSTHQDSGAHIAARRTVPRLSLLARAYGSRTRSLGSICDVLMEITGHTWRSMARRRDAVQARCTCMGPDGHRGHDVVLRRLLARARLLPQVQR